MSHYPPPPGPGQHHYNPVYPAVATTSPLDSASQSGQPQFGNAMSAYSKTEPSDASQIQYTLAQELQRTVDRDDHGSAQSRPVAHMLLQQQGSHQPVQSPGFLSQTPPQQQADQPTEHAKSNRLRKACDSCSVRKVKCDETGPPCRACAALDIPCTFSRPTKRRGPPNRHAQALKRQKIESESAGYSGPSSPASPTNAAQALAALSAQTSVSALSADSICPIETLDLLINDFFTYIHPLCPFPHEPSFREAWKRREDLTNKSFLALLASMIGALVASFPRKPRLHIQAQRKEKLFPNHMSLVHRCQHVCALARGPGYLESEHISVYDAATSYFLALMGVYTFRWRQGRLYFAECLTIIRTLGLHKPDDGTTDQALGTLPDYLGTEQDSGSLHAKDNITVQIGRRIFWTMFVSVKTLQQLGTSFGELQIPPPTVSDPYPPLPLEVDDFCIYPEHIDAQPPGILSIIAGFNANVRAFSSYNSLSTMELAWGIDHIVDWDRQKKVLKESLARCKDATASMPPELRVGLQHKGQTPNHDGNGRRHFYQSDANREPARSLLSLAGLHDADLLDPTAEERRHMQYEIQKANIYASSLSTRSYIVQKYWNLVEAHARARTQQTPAPRPTSPHSPSIGIVAAGLDGMLPQHHLAPTSGFDMIEQEFTIERETIVKDLLIVLSSIDQVNMEPNADSFTMKIRSIASTLLDAPDSRRGQMELQTKEYLQAFLEILIRLERVSSGSEADQAEDEAAQLRDWANLREYQLKFAQEGGFLA